MIYRLDADQNGIGSIRSLVEKGLVTNIDCPNLSSYDRACEKLLETCTKDDLVILDTATQMMQTVLGDLKLGEKPGLLANKVAKLMFEDDHGAGYRGAGQAILRWLRMLRNKGITVITTMHEKEQQDPLTYMKKYGPGGNQDFFNGINASCSDMFRLKVTLEDEIDAEGRVTRPAYSRVLQMKLSDEAITKAHVEEEIPAELSNPTLPRLYKAMRGKPDWLTVYGPPGVGKTSFACSEAKAQLKKEN